MTIKGIIYRLKSDPKDAWYYIQGNVRQFLYDRKWLKWLIRRHIVQQYEYRKIAAKACSDNGECICCGCETPSLFFANKGCSIAKIQACSDIRESPCYPEMKNEENWKLWKRSSRKTSK